MPVAGGENFSGKNKIEKRNGNSWEESDYNFLEGEDFTENAAFDQGPEESGE